MKDWRDFKSFTIKNLLRAAYLNGVFTKQSINKFLDFNSTIYKEPEAYNSQDDDDEWPSDSDDESLDLEVNF